MESRTPTQLLVSFLIFAFVISGCQNATNSNLEDISAGGLAAGAVGGILAAANPSGSLAYRLPEGHSFRPLWKQWLQLERIAEAASQCPTFASTNGCTQINPTTLQFLYSGCHFGSFVPSWTGTIQDVNTFGSGTFSCGMYPTNSFSQQFVNSSGIPSFGTRRSTVATLITIDDGTANLGNYEATTIPPTINTGYGDEISLSGSGLITSLRVNRHVSASNSINYSISGNLAISGSGGTQASPWRASGSVSVYNNILTVLGSSQFTSVGYENSCCLPTSGTIKTIFHKTSKSDPTGSALDGKTETLTFTGCGTATLLATDGTTKTVNEVHCF